jgi:hypothetical protein
MNTIRVGPAILEIVESEMDEFGRFDEDKEKIFVRRGLTPYVRARTVLHEVLHAIWLEYDLPKEGEESCVRRLESGIVAFVLDNPEYTKKIISELIKGNTGGKKGGSAVTRR